MRLHGNLINMQLESPVSDTGKCAASNHTEPVGDLDGLKGCGMNRDLNGNGAGTP